MATKKPKGKTGNASKQGKMSYQNTIYKRRFNKAYKSLLQCGMLPRQIEVLFGLGTNNTPKLRKDPEFEKEYQDAMYSLELQLSSEMMIKALGYDYEEEKITLEKVDGKWVEKKKELLKKHQAGSSAMFIFLMTNRFSNNWRSSREIITKKENYDSAPTERARKQIASLARDVLEASTSESARKHLVQTGFARVSDGSPEGSEE